MWLVSLSEEEMWGHRNSQDVHAQRKGHMRTQQEASICEQGEASGEPNLLTPWQWTSSLRSGRRWFLLFRSSSQWYSVMAALANYYTGLKSLALSRRKDQSSKRSRLLQLLRSQTGAFKKSLLTNRKKKPHKDWHLTINTPRISSWIASSFWKNGSKWTAHYHTLDWTILCKSMARIQQHFKLTMSYKQLYILFLGFSPEGII